MVFNRGYFNQIKLINSRFKKRLLLLHSSIENYFSKKLKKEKYLGMKNRLQFFKRSMFLIAFCWLAFTNNGLAQPFTFNYSGVDSFYVDATTCTATLDWGHPATVTASCNTPGCVLTFFDLISISGGFNIGDDIPAGTQVIITYRAEDDMNNVSFYGFPIYFVDNTIPVFDPSSLPPATISYDCVSDGQTYAVSASDNCANGASVPVTETNTTPPSDCVGGTYERIWTATDQYGNSTSYTQVVTINPDNTAPVISGPFVEGSTFTYECNSASSNAATYDIWFQQQLADFTASVSDTNGCGGAVTISPQNAPVFNSTVCGTTTVTFSATDACNNASFGSANFEIVETTPVAITDVNGQNVIVQCNLLTDTPIQQIQNWAQNNFTVVDGCGNLSWSNNYSTLVNGCGGTTGQASVTYTVTDGCGNSDNITVNFNVLDSNPPNITNGAIDITVECDGAGNVDDLTTWINDRAGAIAVDVCTPTPQIIEGLNVTSDPTTNDPFVALQNAFAAGCNGTNPATITVEFTYTDLCNNTSTSDADFIIIDSSMPTITFPAAIATVNCTDQASLEAQLTNWINTAGGAMGTDICSGVSFRADPPLAQALTDFQASQTVCGRTGSVDVDFYISDACGTENPIPTSASFNVVDITDPVWTTGPTDITVECDGTNDPGGSVSTWLSNNGGGTAADDCSSIVITNNYNGVTNTCGASGAVLVTFTAEDACGNTTDAIATVTIVDTTAPSWTTDPSDLTIACDGTADPGGAIQNWLNTNGATGVGADACSGVTYSHDYTGVSSSCGSSGSTTVTFTVTDDCGLAANATALLTIVDNDPPVLTSPAFGQVVECDGSGNTGELNAWLANYGGASATDNCGDVTWTSDFPGLSDLCGATGAVTVTFTGTDPCGLTVTTSATFTIADTSVPTIFDQAEDITVECNFLTTEREDWINAHGNSTATDNCSLIDNSDIDSGTSSWTFTSAGFVPACGNSGTETVTFTVTDECGLSSSTTATMTLVDNISPEINPTSTDFFEACGGNDQGALEAWINNTGGAIATDGCGDITWVQIDWQDDSGATGTGDPFAGPYPTVSSGDCSYVVEVTFTVVDECMNTSTTTSSFWIIDQEAPVMSGVPANVTVECDNVPAPAMPTAIDNCDADVTVTLNEVRTNGVCTDTYTLTRTWTATDDCGNVTADFQIITVEDTTPPTLNGIPGAVTIECNTIPNPPVIGTDITGSDNCDVQVEITFAETSTQGTDPADCSFYNYTITRIWTGVDNCFNETTSTQLITVQDTTVPTFTTPADVTVECENAGNLGFTGDLVFFSDNCDPAATIGFTDVVVAGSCPDSYTINRTWTATDACGNVGNDLQVITVEDSTNPTISTIAQDMMVDCGAGVDVEAAFAAWVANNASAIATDNCGNIDWFAAVPGSFDPMDATTWPGTPTTGLDMANCPSTTAGVFRSETVEFVAFDECGNASVTTATFSVTDTTPPVFQSCPVDVTVANNPGACEATFVLNAPVITEDCANTMSTLNYTDTEVITSPVPGDDSTIVNPVQLDFAVIPAAPAVAASPVTITIDLINVDAEEPTEFFIITGEDGSVLGNTLNTVFQCGDSQTTITIPASVFNVWAQDGTLSIILTPNVPAGQPAIFAINDICPQGPPTGGGSSVVASLDYVSNSPMALDYKYSINGGSNVFVDPIAAATEVLPVGVNTITYCATDCAGNSSFCTYTVTVEDTEPATITCPADITLTVGPDDNCEAGIQTTLPLPTNMNDNCGFGGNYSQTQPTTGNGELLTFTYNPNYLDYVADDTQFNFLNTAANAAGNSVTFTVTVIGDVEGTEEYFTLVDENGNVLGTTEVGQPNVVLTPGDCNVSPIIPGMSVTTITVPVATYNAWAADGIVTVDAISNINFASPPPGVMGDGINPVCTVFANGTPDGQTDGTSSISMDLDYTFVTPSYYITGATTVPLTQMFPPSIAPIQSFNGGVSNVCYQIADAAGNISECCFDVTVVDNTPPTVVCQPTTVFVNPSGIGTIEFDPATIDGGSFDNCGIDTIYSSPDVIDCTMAGSSVNVILTVIDNSGNASTCSTPVLVSTEQPNPAFGLGICGNSDLQLFANPPAANGGVIYSYQWSGPNGFMSNQENPIISSALATAGFYTVTVTGISGCQSSNTIEVVIPPNTNTPVLAISDNSICTNGNATLSTQFYPGTNVTYYWYTGFAPNGTQIGATASQNFMISNATPGVFNYYVVVDVDGCVSNESNNQSLTVDMGVIATTNDTALNVCEGETIILGTNTSCTNCTYQWTGPNGFNSIAQFPPAFNSVNASAGTYTLTINSNGCPSSPVTTEVNVTAAPPTPQVAVSGLGCEGDDIVLTANIPNAATYTWVSPTFQTTTTLTNTLTIFNASSTDVGDWTVYTSQNGCDSQVSVPAFVTVEPAFSVAASNAGPACDGGTVELTTTTVPGATYQWTGPNGYVSFTQTPTAPAIAGTYTVEVTSAAGCTASSATNVMTQAAPEVTAISNDGTSCANGETVTLVPTIFPVDQGQYTYSWTGPNGFVSNLPSPAIPNATSSDNGNYILTVSNGFGCTSSVMSTTVAITDAPAIPEIGMQSALCEGDNMTLTTNSYAGSNVVYTWDTPQGVITTVTPVLNVPNVATANSGDYTVMVSVDGCDSFESGIMPVGIFAMPPTPTANVNGNCAGEDLQLFTTAIAGASYLWTGPNGFTSTIANPMIMNASASDEGNYSVQVVIGSCVSTVSEPIFVGVDAAPAVPVAMNSGDVCISDPNAAVVLEVAAGSTVPGAIYTWHEVVTEQVIGVPTTDWTTTVPNLSNYPSGTYQFYVVSSLNGCTSEPSIATTVTITDVPNVNAFAGTDINFCGDGTTNLNATAPAVGTGLWIQTSGPVATIANPTAANTTISDLVAGNTYTFMWSLSSGACADYDADEVVVTVETATDVAQAESFETCDPNTVTLNATAPAAGVSGMWTQPVAQAALGVVITNPSDPNSTVTGLQSDNNYTFTWTLSNAACGDFSNAVAIVQVLETVTSTFAGADQVICNGTDAVLTATTVGSGTGTWTAMDSNVSVSTPNQETTVVFNLQPGANVFMYAVDNGVCGMADDEVIIFVESGAAATDDTYTIPFNGTGTMLDIAANDATPSAYTTTITEQPSNGTITVNNDGSVEFLPTAGYAGADEFTYMICSDACPGICATAVVALVIGEDVACEAPSIITPNGDGINDEFIVSCLNSTTYENNTVVIFNQWGDEVYRKRQYLNDWMGTYEGNDLPASTYFYVVDLGDGSEPMTGFLIIER